MSAFEVINTGSEIRALLNFLFGEPSCLHLRPYCFPGGNSANLSPCRDPALGGSSPGQKRELCLGKSGVSTQKSSFYSRLVLRSGWAVTVCLCVLRGEGREKLNSRNPSASHVTFCTISPGSVFSADTSF